MCYLFLELDLIEKTSKYGLIDTVLIDTVLELFFEFLTPWMRH